MKKNIYLMYAISLLQGMVFYGPIATLYRQANGINILQISIIEGISYVLCIVLEIPWGILADRIGYKKSLSSCCFTYLVSKIIFWKANGFLDFLLERILLSIVMSGLSGLDTSILYLSCDKKDAHKVFSIYNSLGLVGLTLASLIFSTIIQSNYSCAALLTIVSYGLAAVLSLLLSEVKNTRKENFHLNNVVDIIKHLFKNKKFILFLISVAFLSQTHQTITVFLNQLKYQKCQMSDAFIGYVYILVTLAGTLGIFSDKLTRKIGTRFIGEVLYILAIISCLILCFTHNASLSIIAVLLLNITWNLFYPYQMAQQNKFVRTANRATELSVYAIMINLVSSGTSILYGYLANLQLNIAFIFGVIICLIGLSLSHIGYKNMT